MVTRNATGVLVSGDLGKSLNKKRPTEVGQVGRYGMSQCQAITKWNNMQQVMRGATGVLVSLGIKKVGKPKPPR